MEVAPGIVERFFTSLDVWWPPVAGIFGLLTGVLASVHVLLYKRDARSALGWMAVLWLVPVLGAVLYLIFGINRVHRRAAILRNLSRLKTGAVLPVNPPEPSMVVQIPGKGNLARLSRLAGHLSGNELLKGNGVALLRNGDEAYPRMLEAIASAKRSVSLSAYIFDRDEVGRKFVEALLAAKQRGVSVRVLVDDIGIRYSWPSVVGALREAAIPHARFLRSLRPLTLPHVNLRKHRKSLVVDGELAFIGGMNLRKGHWLSLQPSHPVQDRQFEVRGPVVRQIQQVFVEDWLFTTGENLTGQIWFPELPEVGPGLARAIADGPDEERDALPLLFLGAISAAEESIQIVTPYFLPDPPLLTSLMVKAAKGITVDILLPQQGNLPFVHWAATPQFGQLLESGCRIWLTPVPFHHTKYFLVDGKWALIGSPNWDPRSLRLNFELALELYNAPGQTSVCQSLCQDVAALMEVSTSYRLDDWQGRSLSTRLRDGFARLFTPYL